MMVLGLTFDEWILTGLCLLLIFGIGLWPKMAARIAGSERSTPSNAD